MKRLLCALFFLSCAGHKPTHGVVLSDQAPGHCRTVCGMTAEVSDFEECDGLVRAEKETLDAFKKHVKWFDRSAACLQLHGWKAVRHKYVAADNKCLDVHWYVQGICVIGFTDERTVEVLPTVPWENSSLPHELAHAIFGYAHCGWKERGIKRALKDLDGQWDSSEDECAPPKPKKHKKKR